MALAISADDVPPEVAATCFGDLGAVDDNDDDSPDEDDSNDELMTDEKNQEKESTEITENKKLKTGRGSSVLHQHDLASSTLLLHTFNSIVEVP